MPLVYATVDDWRTYNGLDEGAPIPANLAMLLQAGSLAVRTYTSVTVYHVDDAGKPTNPFILQAFKDATCAHATAMDALGIDPAKGGVVEQNTYSSKSISGASFTFNTAEQTDIVELKQRIAAGVLAPTARAILDAAGLNAVGPWRAG